MNSEILFYFDFTSPYSYLCWQRICALNLDVRPKPIMVGSLFTAIGSTGPGEIKSKREYLFIDCLRKAQRLGYELRSPEKLPFSPLPMLRTVISLENDKETQNSYISSAFDYGWRNGYDYNDLDKFKAFVLEHVNLSEEQLDDLESLSTSRKALKKNIKEAQEDQVFGVPTLIDKNMNEKYWGLDSLDFLLESQKKNILYNEKEYQRFLEATKDLM